MDTKTLAHILKQDTPAKFLGELSDFYFSPYAENDTDFAQFAALYKRATELKIDNIKANFDIVAIGNGTETEKGIPEHFGLEVGPIRKRSANKDGMIQLGLYAYCVPSPELIISDTTQDGLDFRNSAILGAYRTKIRLSTTPDKDGNIPLEAPYSLEDWIKRAERGEGLKTFNEDAPTWVAFLKKQGLKTMTPQLLRLCLQSQAYAESIFKTIIKGEEWDKLLQAMAAKAKKDGRNPAIYENWLETRHNVDATVVEFKGLGVLDDMLAAMNAESDAASDEAAGTTEEAAETTDGTQAGVTDAATAATTSTDTTTGAAATA